MTFPASDPITHGKPTGNEPSKRPVDRKAPIITKEQIDQAQVVRVTSRASASARRLLRTI